MKERDQRCAVRIGTSGWHYKHWLGPFYPANLRPKDMLAWYMERFDTVELNNSFYHLPARETFEAWCRATPASFCFSVKGSRYITHRKKLNDPAPALARFMEPVESLGDKLRTDPLSAAAAMDMQCAALDRLPGRAAAESPVYVRISRSELARSRRLSGTGTAQCRLLLVRARWLRGALPADGRFRVCPAARAGTQISGDYSSQQLRDWARRIARWRQRLKAVYVYFDNDQAGYAAKNAAELKSMVTQ